MISKKYVYDYDDYEDGSKDSGTMLEEILEDPKLGSLEEIIIGCWGECFDEGIQPIIDGIVANKSKFAHIKHLFFGDMTFEECEVSWIQQGDYSKLWEALPALEELTIKGSENLTLGEVCHEKLKSLEIICGGIPKLVLEEIASAKLPVLEKLNIYIGIDNYGFDGDIEDITKVVGNPSFGNLKYLGIGNSDIQDAIVERVMASGIVQQLEVLDFSNGTLSDVGGKILLEHQAQLSHLKLLDLHHHFLSDDMKEKLSKLPIEVDLEEQEDNDEDYGNWPLLTE
ncbi:MAG: STM4015 family protein [Cellulosilyticaceae bacterium]